MFDMLFEQVGSELEYAVDTVIEPANEALGRSARVSREWVKFNAAVGTPVIPPDTGAELAKVLSTAIQIHTAEEIPTETPIRYEGRVYLVMNHHGGPHIGGERLNRYQCRATLQGDGRVI